MQKKYFIIVLIGLLFFSCQTRQSKDLDLLLHYMSGSFSSANQAKADTNFLDIRLEMVPIWPDQKPGYWLYVEQAAAWNLDKPYRQRIYHLTAGENRNFSSAVYTFKNPLRFAGKYKTPEVFDVLTPDSLLLREGCAIIMKKQADGTFSGSTVDNECGSDLRGASYATSEVTIYADKLVSWDRGWNAEHEQVWGSVKGGYIFEKVNKH